MSREEFVRRNGPVWDAFERQVARLEGPAKRRDRTLSLAATEAAPDLAEFDRRYRAVCRHLVLARRRLYGADLEERLNDLARRGHRHLYGRRPGTWAAIGRFVARDFPEAVRAQWKLVLAAIVLFYGPYAAAIAWIAPEPDRIHLLLDSGTVSQLEEMYDPASGHYGKERESDSDLRMFGFYVFNNVGLAFRTFAGGILLGVGSAFFLAFNGLYLGSATAYLLGIGFGTPFLSFTAGHGAFELTAIVLAGAAGLRLGLPLVSPGRKTRGEAMLEAAREAVTIVYGVAGMLVLAAFVEAFWSPRSSVPPEGKYAVGAALWILTIGYFLFAGRRRAA